jgi:IclR family transcriptional regulator, acetate operon repressor
MPNLETPNRYQVRSVARALEMLAAVGESGEAGLTLTDMAQRLDMAKSSTMAAARTLASFGFLRIESPGPRYHLGLALLRYGDMVAQMTSLGKVALPLLHELTEETGLTSRLAINEEGYPVFVERVDGRGAVRFHAPLGQRESPHSTGAGKAILAQLDEEDVRRIVGRETMVAHTANTLTSIEAVLSELRHVQLVGYAIDNEEEAEGIICVGAPIFDYSAACVGAVSVTGLKVDITQRVIAPLCTTVSSYAERISALIGNVRLA